MKWMILIIAIPISYFAKGDDRMPDCSGMEEFKSSIYAMLRSELLPINLNTPEIDAKIRYKMGDYRLLGYGLYSGIHVPGVDLLGGNKICEYGVRTFSGMTDAYESYDHKILVKALRSYIEKYNAYILSELQNKE